MNINDIRAFIRDDVIFKRGLNYYKKGYVVRFIREEGLVEALVSGTARRPYHVQIKMDRAGKPRTSFCNCPYAGGMWRCKHIAAVLIYDSEINRPVENPIQKQRVIEQETVIDLKKTRAEAGAGIDLVRYLTHATGLLAETDGRKRFRLVFVIDHSRGYPHDRWMLYPASRYVRANGEEGRFDRFKDERITEAFGREEKMLLYRLTSRPEANDELVHHMDFLLENRVSCLYVKHETEHSPVSFEEINTLRVNFLLDRIRGKGAYFGPEILCEGNGKSFLLPRGTPWRYVRSGFTFFIIGEEGRILFSRENEKAADLLELLLVKKRLYTYSDVRRLKGFFTARSKGIRIGSIRGELRIRSDVPKPFIEVEQRYGSLYIDLWFSYGEEDIPFSSGIEYIPLESKGRHYAVLKRNYDFEGEVFEFLKRKFKHILTNDFFSKSFRASKDLSSFLVEHGKKLLDEGIEIRLKGKKQRISPNPGSVVLRVEPGMDWFDVRAYHQDPDESMKEIEIDPSLLSGGLIKAGDSYIIITEKDIKKLKSLMEEGMSRSGELKVSKFRFHLIDEYYRDIANRHEEEIERLKKIAESLRSFKKIREHELPRGFKGTLREYQHAGYNWLFFLHEHMLGGCLADDMGLGKTVQTLAFLQRLKEESIRGTSSRGINSNGICDQGASAPRTGNRGSYKREAGAGDMRTQEKASRGTSPRGIRDRRTSLLVVPVNTIANWESEIRRFTPRLRYFLHYGSSRNREALHTDGYDFILSSYHTVRSDIETFRKMHFDCIILDESQCIKNSNSQLFKAVRTLKSDHRLSLTGTPIENSTFELWAQMEFLNPGILGSRTEFSRRFVKPIEKYSDRSATGKLRKITFPFILRRRKEDVLRELPDKSEITLYSRMGSRQSSIYEQHRHFFQKAILRRIEKDGLEKSAIQIFSALLKLRQIALFPALADAKFASVDSCKFEQMKEIVEEILREDHKIAIFSQFVGCLDIIKGHFQKKRLRYSYIDGSVAASKRKVQIQQFQEKEDCRLFLASLKAGGVGINLTAADYVILFDPWWNPAVESQAVDRLHRIGQEKKVFAYKLVVKDTVEEKMLELQQKKKKLVRDLITEESGFFKSLTEREIASFFDAQ